MTTLLYIITAISLIANIVLIIVGIIFFRKIQKLKGDTESLSKTNTALTDKWNKDEEALERVLEQMKAFAQRINELETPTRESIYKIIMNLPWPNEIKEEARKSVSNKLIDAITIESKILKSINTIMKKYIFYDLTNGYKSDEKINDTKKFTVLARFIYISFLTMNAVYNYESIKSKYKETDVTNDNDIYDYILSNKWNSNIENDLTIGHDKVPFWARMLEKALSDIPLKDVELDENEYFILMGFNFYNKKAYINQ